MSQLTPYAHDPLNRSGSTIERRGLHPRLTDSLRFSYNRYLAVASRAVRRSLKEDVRLAAERRGQMDLRFAKWSVSFDSRVPSANDSRR